MSLNGQGRLSPVVRLIKGPGMEPPVAELPREHGKTMVSERLVEERFLPIQRFDPRHTPTT